MGNNIKNVIEINGKRYDAITGSFLGNATEAAHQTTAPRHSAKSVDGFSPSNLTSRAVMVAKPAPKKARAPHTPAVHATPHRPEPAKTLMRTAVKKPLIQSPARLKAQTRTDILAKVPTQVVAPKLSHATVDAKRLKKAHQMIQSPAVSRYATPQAISTLPPSPKTTLKPNRALEEFHARNAAPAPLPKIPVAAERRHARQPDIFEQALARANSHEQTYDQPKSAKRKGRRLARLITASMCLLLIAGMVAYVNAPALSMRLASSRAGFSAKLPGYYPAGYSFGGLSYGPGNVTISYKAANETEKFDITQKVSEWDSQALLNNFVANANKAYQTYERAGRTIYFFGNNTATWVDSGVWYTVNGNSSLSKNQLLDLAGSI